MVEIRTNRWIAIIGACLVSFVAGSNATLATENRPETTATMRSYHATLNNFAASKGPAIDRESIHKILFAITRNERRVGVATKIADNLYLTASHILSVDPSENRIRSYTTHGSYAFSVLAQDERNDIALLQTQETDTPRPEPLVEFASTIPAIGDTVSYFLLLPKPQSEPYETELRGRQPLSENTESDDIYLGRLIAPQSSFTYEIEGFVLPYDLESIEAHLERNQQTANPLYGPEDLSSPEYACLTTVFGYNGASGGGVFKKTATGYELVGILTTSVTERHLIAIPKSPRGFTRLQQNYSIFTHRKAIVDLIGNYLSD